MEELLSILMKLDFIRNHECRFEPKDLLEMAKSATIEMYEAGKPIFKQEDEANAMCFILQGRCTATYKMASQD